MNTVLAIVGAWVVLDIVAVGALVLARCRR